MRRPLSNDQTLQQCANFAHGRALRLAVSLMGNVADAEDLVQRALMIAQRKLDQAPRRRLWAWFASIVTLEARNLRRARSRRAAREAQMERDFDWPESRYADPAKQFLEGELRERLWESFRKLAEKEREALALVFLSGMTRKEAAAVVGVSESTLRNRVEAGLGVLRKQLDVPKHSLTRALSLLPLPLSTPAMLASIGSISQGATALQASGGKLPLLIGEVFVMKKLTVAVIALFLLLGAALVWHLASLEADSQRSGSSNEQTGSITSSNRSKTVSTSSKGAGVTAASAKDSSRVIGGNSSSTTDGKSGDDGSGEAAREESKSESELEADVRTISVVGTDGKSIVGAKVVGQFFGNGAGGRRTFNAQTDANGEAKLSAGVATIEIHADGYADQGMLLAEGLTQDQRITLRAAASIEVLVRSPDGEALSSIPVMWEYIKLEEDDGAPPAFDLAEYISAGATSDLSRLELFASPPTFTKRDGSVNFDSVPSGIPVRVRLAHVLRKPNGQQQIWLGTEAEIVTLIAGETRVVTLKPYESQRLVGRLMTSSGEPCIGAVVFANFHHLHDKITTSAGTVKTRTDADGRFQLFADLFLTAGVSFSWTSPEGRSYGQSHYHPSTETAIVDIGRVTLNPVMEVSGRVSLEGKPLEYSSVSLDFYLGEERYINNHTVSREGGEFSFGEIQVNEIDQPTFRATLTARDGMTRLNVVDVTEALKNGEPLIADFTAPRMTKVRVKLVGMVADESAKFDARKLDDPEFAGLPHMRMLAGEDSEIELEPGRYRFRIEQESALSHWQELDAAVGTQPSVTVVVQAAAQLKLHLAMVGGDIPRFEGSVHCSLVPVVEIEDPETNMRHLNGRDLQSASWPLPVGARYRLRCTLGEHQWEVELPEFLEAKSYEVEVKLPEGAGS